MGDGERAGPTELRLVIKHPADVPPELIAQKDWDADAYFQWARNDPGENVFGVELYDGNNPRPVALMIMVHNAIYRGVCQDSIIIDQPHRSVSNLKRYQRAFVAYAMEFARMVGATHVTGSTPRPRAMMKVMGDDNWRIAETVIRRDV
jgi:hypothetical protein